MKICYNCFNEITDSAKTCPHCGSSADLRNVDKYPHAMPCGAVLNGRYIVGRVLGQGGFGITYVGQDFKTKKLVAIKEYFPDTMATRDATHSVMPFNTDRSEGFEYGKKQFLDEAKTLAAFIGSPNIVRVSNFFEENGTAYFVMEYVRGTSLRQYIAGRGGRIPWEEAWNLLMPVVDALSEVHFRNIIHRDIKPDNIIITKNGSAKLIDFGAARYSYSEKSKSLTAVLTPGYAPVEQYFSRGRQGPWTDVYALAATIYFCITGKAPVESVERSVYDDLKNPSELGISIPAYAETALMKALSVREENRYRSTYDFRNAVLEGKRLEEEKTGGTDIGGLGTPVSAGEKSGQEKSWEDSYRKALDLALQGDSDAQYLLGYFYESGTGVQQSDELAEKWYRRAAAKGNTAAQAKLSLMAKKKTDEGQDNDKLENGPQSRAPEAEYPRPQDSGSIRSIERLPSNENKAGTKPLQSDDLSKSDREPKNGKGKTGQDPSIRGGDGREQNKADANEKPPARQDIQPGETPDRTSKDRPVDSVPQGEKNTRSLKNIIIAAVLIVLIAGAAFLLWTGGGSEISRDPMELTDTWEEIAAAGRDRTYKKRYRIGDTKELDMGSEGIITMKLVAMDEDELADGSGKAPMTWVADELLQSEHNMEPSLTDSFKKGSWDASGMRAWLRKTVLPLMPEEVRNNIREVTKYSYSSYEKKDVTTKDTIWIPSVKEVFPAAHSWRRKSIEKEGVSYDGIFSNDLERKRSRDGESSASVWWLRSAYYGDYSTSHRGYVCVVGSDGDRHDYPDILQCGVVVGFCF